MIFFSFKKLEYKILNDELSDKDVFIYMLNQIILIDLMYELLFLAPYEESNLIVSFIQIVVDIIAVVVGNWYVFKINEKLNGKDFFKRYIVISWVAMWRTCLVSILLYTPFVMTAFLDINQDMVDWLFIGVSIIIFSIYYSMMAKSFTRLAN